MHIFKIYNICKYITNMVLDYIYYHISLLLSYKVNLFKWTNMSLQCNFNACTEILTDELLNQEHIAKHLNCFSFLAVKNFLTAKSLKSFIIFSWVWISNERNTESKIMYMFKAIDSYHHFALYKGCINLYRRNLFSQLFFQISHSTKSVKSEFLKREHIE